MPERVAETVVMTIGMAGTEAMAMARMAAMEGVQSHMLDKLRKRIRACHRSWRSRLLLMDSLRHRKAILLRMPLRHRRGNSSTMATGTEAIRAAMTQEVDTADTTVEAVKLVEEATARKIATAAEIAEVAMVATRMGATVAEVATAATLAPATVAEVVIIRAAEMAGDATNSRKVFPLCALASRLLRRYPGVCSPTAK